MKFRSIKMKIAVLSGLCLLGTAAAIEIASMVLSNSTSQFVGTSTSALVDRNTKDYMQNLASTQAGLLRSEFDTALHAARIMADTFSVIAGDKGMPADGRRATFDFPPVDKDRAFACIDAMRPIAERRGVSVAQIALAWLLHRRAVTSVIIGAKRLDQLEDNLAATEVDLTAEELDTLDAVSALPPEYPGWMFERQAARAQQVAEAGRRLVG